MQPVQTKIDLYRGQITPWHKKILKDWNLSQYKILWAGRKARKTTFDINELMFHAMTDPRGLTYPFIGPTLSQAREIAWDDHVAQIIRLLNDTEIDFEVNKSERSVAFKEYSKFVLDGADNIESLRGKSDWGGVVCDEFASWRNKRYSWEEVIEPNLSVHNAWAIISGTPQGFEYHHLLMKRGDHDGIIEGEAYDDEGNIVLPNKNYRSYRFTSYDNPWANRKFIDDKRETMSESAFGQEYLAKASNYTGLVFKNFDRTIHLVDKVDLPGNDTYYRAMDFGAINPTVCLFIRVDHDGNYWIYDEYYQTERTTKDNAYAIQAKHPQTAFRATFGDPSGKQERLDYAGYGLHITPANKQVIDVTSGSMKEVDGHSWVLHRINLLQERLKINPITLRPRLLISKNCVNLIRELESYRWEERKDKSLNEKDVPVKADDHTIDALGYFACSYAKTPKREFKQPIRPQSNSITGY